MVRAKKHLGQHFLNDEAIAQNIVSSLTKKGYKKVLEIGPGTGALTKYLILDESIDLYVVELDRDSVSFLKKEYPPLRGRILEEDFLNMNFESSPLTKDPFAIIGNFPYNISSQILFRVYENRDRVVELVGMFQKEVAQRIASQPGNKDYGILSVLLQAFYDIEYLFTVNENVFIPPPRVKSAVIRLRRNDVRELQCDQVLFKTVVKTAFNQRRKTLRNALRALLSGKETSIASGPAILNKRAEQLSVKDFVNLTSWIEGSSVQAQF